MKTVAEVIGVSRPQPRGAAAGTTEEADRPATATWGPRRARGRDRGGHRRAAYGIGYRRVHAILKRRALATGASRPTTNELTQ